MPREMIWSPGNPGERSQPFAASVGWSHDRDMQVGIVLPKKTPQMPQSVLEFLDPVYVAEVVVKHVPAIGEVQLAQTSDEEKVKLTLLGERVIADLVKMHPMTDGYWWTPTRHEVNTFIKLLRRARDVAFGKDE